MFRVSCFVFRVSCPALASLSKKVHIKHAGFALCFLDVLLEVRKRVSMCVHVCVRVGGWVQECTCRWVGACVCMCVCMCMCM